jgi:MFS family permease
MPDLMPASHRTDSATPLQRRNFYLNVANGALSYAGGRAADLGTVVPLLVLRLVGAEWAVGLAQAVQDTARVAMQLFASRLLDARPHKRPPYVFWSVVRVFALCTASGALLTGVGREPWIVLSVLLACLFLLMVGNGVAELAWSDITARSVPSRRRGSLMTGRRVIGLVLSLIVAAPLVDYLLSPRSPYAFPANYGMLFVINTVLSIGAWTVFSLTREPNPDAARHRLSLRQHFTRGVRILQRDDNYRSLLQLKFLLGLTAALPTFFVAFGKVALGLPDRSAAMFLSLRMVSEICGSLVLGRISDGHGNRRVIMISTWLGVLTFGLATASALLAYLPAAGTPPPALCATLLSAAFLALGLLQAARDMGEFNYMLDIAPGLKRTSYLSFANAFLLPLSLLPIGVGILVPFSGYLPLFGAATLVSGVAIVASRRLDEPRENKQRAAEAPRAGEAG